MPEPLPTTARARRGVGSAGQVAAASLLGALVSYVVLWLGARHLSTADNTVLLTFISILFAVYGLLSGVATETTRAVATGIRDRSADGPPMWVAGAVVAAVVGACVLALAPWWQPAVLHRSSPVLVGVLAAGAVSYTFHSVIIGSLVGSGWWRESALVLVADAAARLALCLAVVLLVGASTALLAVASTAGAVAWVGVLVLVPHARAALRRRADSPPAALARRMSASMLAQTASAVLVVGFPALLSVTTSTVDFRHSAPLLLAISLTRAPVLIPLNAVQGLVVSHLVHAPAVGLRLVLRLTGAVVAVTVIGAVLAWLVGPALMEALFGAAYRVDGPVLAGLTVGACAIAALTLSGAATQSSSAHSWFVGGWALAAVTSFLLLLVPGSIEQRSVIALVVGPAVGLLVHAVGFLRAASRRASERLEAGVGNDG